MKIKFLDYARHGLFTVVTPSSLQGVNDDPEAPFIVASSINMFTEAVLRHAAVPQQPHTALAYVSHHYDTENAFAWLRTALNTIDRAQI